MAVMTDADRRKLASILGMLGSNSAGERDNAARQAEALRKKHGMTWEQLLQERIIYADREVVYVDRPVAVWREPTPWLDRLLIIGIWLGVPSGMVALAAAFR